MCAGRCQLARHADRGGPALLTCFSLGGTWNCEVVALIIATSRSCSMHPALKASSPAPGFPSASASVACRRLLPTVHPELPMMCLYVRFLPLLSNGKCVTLAGLRPCLLCKSCN